MTERLTPDELERIRAGVTKALAKHDNPILHDMWALLAHAAALEAELAAATASAWQRCPKGGEHEWGGPHATRRRNEEDWASNVCMKCTVSRSAIAAPTEQAGA